MQDIASWFICFSFLGGAAIALVGVVIGAFAVFRTKRESCDPFFTVGNNKGEAFNIDDDFGQPPDTKIEWPKASAMANDAFVQQFAQNLAEKASK